jgi:hypothetical protein
MDKFTRGMLTTALWSTSDESDDLGGEPLDQNYNVGDVNKKCLAGLVKDAEKFQRENADDLAAVPSDSETCGHDYWLTRNDHGAGYWDDDYPEPYATRLTEAAKRAGNIHLSTVRRRIRAR